MPSEKYNGYRGKSRVCLKSFSVGVWYDVEIDSTRGKFKGIILPRSETADSKHIVLKLRNGYNVGLAVDAIKDIKELGHKEAHYKIPEKKFPYNP
ncbi:Glu-tRNA(Gln) amidotransferase GatDE subunit D, partial [bacterium]